MNKQIETIQVGFNPVPTTDTFGNVVREMDYYIWINGTCVLEPNIPYIKKNNKYHECSRTYSYAQIKSLELTQYLPKLILRKFHGNCGISYEIYQDGKFSGYTRTPDKVIENWQQYVIPSYNSPLPDSSRARDTLSDRLGKVL